MVLPTIVALKYINRVTGTITDISNDFFSSPVFTDTGSGEVNSAILVISADQGTYITSAPVIDGYDRIYWNMVDSAGNTYAKTFYVILTVPVETKTSGTKLELHLVGIESDLQKIFYIKPWYGATAFSVGVDIFAYYNGQRGGQQSYIYGNDGNPINNNNSGPGNGFLGINLPNYQTNNYDYGLNQETCYNRVIQVCDKMGGSVANGGILDFFNTKFDTGTSGLANPPIIFPQIISSGSTGNGIVMTNTTSVNVGPTEGGIQAPRGYLVCGWGESTSGSFPPSFSQFSSREIMFGLFQTWQSGITYPYLSYVQYQGNSYQCTNTSGTSTTPPSSSWTLVTEASFYGNIYTYSPWTQNKFQQWANSGSNSANNQYGGSGFAGFMSPGFYDGNMVVQDDQNGAFRTWASYAALTQTTFSQVYSQRPEIFYSNGNENLPYRGLRIICGPSFTGTDIDGTPYANNIVEWDGSEWVVKYVTVNGTRCAVLWDGLVYEFISSAWSNSAASTSANGNDCFHPYQTLNNIPGIYSTLTQFYNINQSSTTEYLSGNFYFVKITGMVVGQYLDAVYLNAGSPTLIAPDIVVAVYSDNNGTPNTLLSGGYGNADTLNAGIYKYYFQYPVYVPTSTIWVGFKISGNNGFWAQQSGFTAGNAIQVSTTWTEPVWGEFSQYGPSTNTSTAFQAGVSIDAQSQSGNTLIPWTVNMNSAIRVEYRWSIANQIFSSTKLYYQIGAWLDISVPFPETAFNLPSTSVGNIFGGAIQTNGSPDADREPATIDAENMHLTHNGYRGFNKADAIDYGNLGSLDFWMRLIYESDFANAWESPILVQAANFNMRCIMYDTSDNLVFQDFVIPFNNNWAAISLPLSGFNAYRAIKPYNSIFQFIIPPKELDVNNVFEFQNIKRIVFQTQDSYDSQGRYSPIISTCRWSQADTNLTGNILNVYRRILLDLDGLKFSKPLFTTSAITNGVITDFDVQPDFIERPNMILFDNLQNDVNAQAEIAKFRHIEYDMQTTGFFDTTHGDTLYLYNPRIVSNRNPTTGAPSYTGDPNAIGDLAYWASSQNYLSGTVVYDSSASPPALYVCISSINGSSIAPHSDSSHWSISPSPPPTGTYTTYNGIQYFDNTVKLVANKIEYSLTKPSSAPGGFNRTITGIKRFVGQ